MSVLLAIWKDILKALLWFPKWIRKCRKLMQQEKKESTQAFIENLIHYKESLEKQIPNENDPAKKQALEEELEMTIAAERGYYRKMLERNLEQSDLPAFEALVASGNIVLKPENKANITEAVKQLDKLPPPTTADDFIISGNAKYYTGQYEKALADYNKALQLKPNYAEALYNLGNTYYTLRRYDEALAEYSKALKLKPDYPKALSNRGLSYHHLKRYDEALADFNKALKLKPDLPEALNNRGMTYDELKHFDESLADYNEALKLKPDLPETFNNRGITYGKMEHYDEALADFNKALILKPDYTDTLYNIACLFALQNEVDKALDTLEKAIKLDEKSRKEAAEDSDFDNIRDDPRFKKLIGEK